MTHTEIEYLGRKGIGGIHHIVEVIDGILFCIVPPEVKNPRTKAKHIVTAVNSHDGLLEALERIAKGEGAFSMDPLKHAENCIEDMKLIANLAIAKAKEK